MTSEGLVPYLINDPNAFARGLQTWVEANYWLLGSCAAGGLLACAGAGFIVNPIRERAKRRKELAKRFGGLETARKAGLLRNPKFDMSGIPIGKIGRNNLCWTDQEIVLVTGGTRSGKGVGVMRPAAVTYGGPCVFYDGGKGELYRETAGYRSKFSHVLKFDLTDAKGAHFNFLEEISPANPVAGADNFVKAIPKTSEADSVFEVAAEQLTAAIILHVLHAHPHGRKNMGEVVKLLCRGDDGMKEIAQAKAHSVAVDRVSLLFGGNVLGPTSNEGGKYRQSVYNSAIVRLSAFQDPVVAEVTSTSDFRLSDIYRLSSVGHPVSLYLTTPASEDDRLKPVISMFLTMLINSIMRDQPALDKQPRTLLVLDEFASLRMNIVQTAATKMVGCGCTMLLGAQSLNALSQAPYGPYNQFRDNIRCHVAYAANDAMTQRALMQGAGSYEDTRKSVSGGGWFSQRPKSETESETMRPVVTEGELREMGDEVELIFVTGQRVIMAEKIRDYKHPILKHRLYLPVPPTRNEDGTYYNAPNTSIPSPWANVLVKPPEPEEGMPDFMSSPDFEDGPPERPSPAAVPPQAIDFGKPKAKPRTKRKLIAATED